MSQPIRGLDGHLFFSTGPQNTNFVEGIEILLPVKFRWNVFNGFRVEVKNVSSNLRPELPSVFSNRPKTHKLDGALRSGFLSSFFELCSAFSEKSKMSQSLNKRPGGHLGFSIRQRATYRAPEYHVPPLLRTRQDGHFCSLIGPKNTFLEEDVRALFSVKLNWIPFSGFRGKVENLSANQRPGGHLPFFRLARKTQNW